MLDHNYLKYYTPTENNKLVDLGATLGELGKLVLPQLQATNSLIYCVEPSLWNIERLSKWINESAAGNAVLLGCGVWKEDTSVKLMVSSNFVLHRVEGLENNFNSEDVRTDTMPVLSLDTIINICGGSIDFVKADIEGAELEVFLNCKNIDKVKNLTIAAYHIRDGKKTLETLIPFFESKGFEVKHECESYDGYPPADLIYCKKK